MLDKNGCQECNEYRNLLQENKQLQKIRVAMLKDLRAVNALLEVEETLSASNIVLMMIVNYERKTTNDRYKQSNPAKIEPSR